MENINKNIDKNEFDKINEIESFLYNYKSIKLAIENLKMELENFDGTVIGAIEYKESTGKTNKFNSAVENKLSRKETLKDRIKHMETKINQIDKSLAILPDTEREVIENFYIEGKCYFQFCNELRLSERTTQRIKNRALNKIIISLYGI
jgi:DNA-directed RNA polymerase specialized sigma subunit